MEHLVLRLWIFVLLPVFSILNSCQDNSTRSIDYSALELPNQPNIVWIVAEDLSPYIACFGDSTVRTPNIDRLAAEGITYTNVFSTAGVCSPSRASIATGLYPTRIGAMHMRNGPWTNFNNKDRLIKSYEQRGNVAYEANPQAGVHMHSLYLRRAGYYCANNHKEDYQFRCEIAAWDESSRNATWKNSPKGKPFFAIFNLMETHESKVIWTKNIPWEIDSLMDVPIKPYLTTTELSKRDVRRMYSNIVAMDRKVGEVLDDLESSGHLNNTIIFWYTDHGGPLPREKRTLYDSGIHVPMLVRFPNKQFAGKRDD